MAMNFWAAQERAKNRTWWLVTTFIALTFIVAYIANMVVAGAWDEYRFAGFPWVGIGFIALTFIVALFNYMMYQSQGGPYVAESLGALVVNPKSQNPADRQLLNLVQEMAVATGLPMPAVYVLKNEQINAFAAGTKPENACMCVTTGALKQLNRDELQGVIGHEFGHIYNHDMKLSMKLSAMLMGFFIIFYSAIKLIQFNPIRSNSDSRTSPVIVVAFIMLGAGALSYFAGKILSSMVSRQREFLADASSAQFTRNPEALVSALKKIENEAQNNAMPKEGMAFSHLYFDNRSIMKLFATHPPLQERIAALLGKTYLPE